MKPAGVSGQPTVLAPAAVFESWQEQRPKVKDFFGIAKVNKVPVVVFHDPETSYALPQRDGSILLVQAIFNRPRLSVHLKKLPATGWKRAAGTYRSDGGEHVLWDGMFSRADFDDAALVEDMAIAPPVRIAIPAGDYALEVFGTWKPDSKSEYSLGRLVKL